MHGNRLLVTEAFVEILALQHLRDRVLRGQPDEIFGGELREPPAVEVDHRFFRTENPENLRLVGLGVLRNLLARQRRPPHPTTGRFRAHADPSVPQPPLTPVYSLLYAKNYT